MTPEASKRAAQAAREHMESKGMLPHPQFDSWQDALAGNRKR